MDVHVSLTGRRLRTREIHHQIREAVLDGRLRPGDRLPPTRELAERLEVSRTTVLAAYDRLAGEGFVESRQGAGTFVREGALPESCRPADEDAEPRGALRPRPFWDAVPDRRAATVVPEFDFRTGLVDATRFPFRSWRRLVNHGLSPPVVDRGLYGPPEGDPDLRAEIARHIGLARAVDTDPDGVVVTNGMQQAMDLICRTLVEPGDRVAVEDPGYRPVTWLLRAAGCEVVPVPVDDEGLVVEAIPPGVRLVYVTPSHQYPMGMVMSLRRRLALLEWAEREDAAIVEDDYDSEFRFGGRPIEPLWSLDRRGRVLYVGTFSKTLLPTLRLGFVVAPPSVVPALRRAKFLTDWHTDLPSQQALARFIGEGLFAAHVRRMRKVYAERHELVTTILRDGFADHLRLVPSSVGIHVAARSIRASDPEVEKAVDRAVDLGVLVRSLGRSSIGRDGPAGVVVGYGAIPAERIRPGLELLRSCFEG